MTWRPPLGICQGTRCELEYQPVNGVLDMDNPQCFVRARSRCLAHAAIPEAAIHGIILAESQERERVRFLVLPALMALRTTFTAAEVFLTYDASRRLLVEWEQPTAAERTAVRSLLPQNARLG